MRPGDTRSLDLRWSLREMAQLQGVNLDRVRMESSLRSHAQPAEAAVVKRLLRQVGWGGAQSHETLDVTLLPALAQHRDGRWGVVTKRMANGEWLLVHHDLRRECLGGELTAVVEPRPVSAGRSARQRSFSQVLWRGLRHYAGVIREAIAATFFINVLTAVIAFFSMQVYDRVIPSRGLDTLTVLFGGVVLLIAFEWLMKLARSRLMEVASARLDQHLARHLFERLTAVRLDQMPGSVGSLAAQLRGYEQIRGFFTSATLFVLVDVPSTSIFLLLMLMVGTPEVVAVPLVFAVLATLYGLYARVRIQRLAKVSVAAAHKKTGVLVEAVEGAEVIKAASAGWQFLRRWVRLTAATTESDQAMRRTSEALGHFVAVCQQLSYASLVAVGAMVVIRGDMTMGALIACSILGGRITGAMVQLPSIISNHAHSRIALADIERMYALEQDHHGMDKPIVPGVLRGEMLLDKVAFSYQPEAEPAVRVPRLAIQPGEKVGVIGPIGSGKTTLLRLLAGLYKPDKGTVLMDGMDISQIARAALSENCGYLAQDFRLVEGTLRDNLLLGIPEPGDAVLQEVMRNTGLSEVVAAHPAGIEMPIPEGGRGLSRGQRQLVAFTRMLLANPRIYFMDEPTASMDEKTEARCLGILATHTKRRSDTTVVIVTHKLSLLSLVERLIVVVKGAVVLDGPREEVLAKLRQREAPVEKGTAGAPAPRPKLAPAVLKPPTAPAA